MPQPSLLTGASTRNGQSARAPELGDEVPQELEMRPGKQR